VLTAAESCRRRFFARRGANCITRTLRESDVGARTNKFEEIIYRTVNKCDFGSIVK
jgi:hypothetical protein